MSSVTYDAGSSTTFNAVNGVSWNHTTTSADTAVVHYSLETTFAYSASRTVKWGSTGGAGGTSMTEVTGSPAQYNDGTFYESAGLFYITAASTTISGTQEVTAAWGRSGFGGIGASTELGANQTNPIDSASVVTEASGNANSNLTVTSATGNLVIDCFVGNAGSANFSQNQTSIFKVGASQCGAAQRAAGSASVDMNITASAVQHAHIAAQIKVAAAGGSVFAPYFYRQHIGGGMHGESA